MSEIHAFDYAGDDALDDLLMDERVDVDSRAVRALLRGVLAAPATDPARWLPLLHPAPGERLAGQILALHREMAAGIAPGRCDGARLASLRLELQSRGIDGFIVPRADEHQGEYVPKRAERLSWLTGFEGSAGCAVVLVDRAAIFVDGRYTLQVRDQVDCEAFEPQHLIDHPPHKWLGENLRAGQVFGYDPWLHTVTQAEQLEKAAKKAGATLIATDPNPLDEAWTDQPPTPIAAVLPQAEIFTGQSSESKRDVIGKKLAEDGIGAVVLTTPDAVAWLLNIRGGDVPRTPLPLAFAILASDGTVDLFIDGRKLAPQTRPHLGAEVRIHPPDALGERLDALGAEGATVRLNPAVAAAWIAQRLEAAGATLNKGADPTALPKARKNAVELDGTRAAHRRDGAALCRFLHWLDSHAADGTVSEMQASDKLESFRRENEHFRDLSFDTISGAGPNGAIVHYRVSEETNRLIEPGQLYLVDSGGQYLDGTTDVTRTVAIGEPTSEMRDRFTRVLKGHISLGTARFSKGTTGSQLDALARLPLWQAGLDYDHGTGHGVGSYLGVHEGPQRISKASNTVALEPGMILSNEPGYYKTDGYGIRIENLVVVMSGTIEGGDREMLGFETITLAPIDRRLVDTSLLLASELDWLNEYHARVRDELEPLVPYPTAVWLAKATAPIHPQ